MADFIGIQNMPTAGPRLKPDPKELRSETNFDQNEQAEIARDCYELLNVGQKKLVKTVRDAIDQEKGGIFAAEAHGGTGKSFCINVLLAMLRSEGKIAVAMAISAQVIYFLNVYNVTKGSCMIILNNIRQYSFI